MASFFNAERVEAGWRFFILWTITNLLGLGIGAAIELFLFKQINGNIAVFLAAIGQAWLSASRLIWDYAARDEFGDPRGLKSGVGSQLRNASFPARAEGEKRLLSATRNP